jgi:hypothetical protein
MGCVELPEHWAVGRAQVHDPPTQVGVGPYGEQDAPLFCHCPPTHTCGCSPAAHWSVPLAQEPPSASAPPSTVASAAASATVESSSVASPPSGTSATPASLAEPTVASFTAESPASGLDAVSEDRSAATSATTTLSAESVASASAKAAHLPEWHARTHPRWQTPTIWSGRVTSQQGSPGSPQLIVPSGVPASLPGEPLEVLTDPPQLAVRPATTTSATIPASACFKWSTPPIRVDRRGGAGARGGLRRITNGERARGNRTRHRQGVSHANTLTMPASPPTPFKDV